MLWCVGSAAVVLVRRGGRGMRRRQGGLSSGRLKATETAAAVLLKHHRQTEVAAKHIKHSRQSQPDKGATSRQRRERARAPSIVLSQLPAFWHRGLRIYTLSDCSSVSISDKPAHI